MARNVGEWLLKQGLGKYAEAFAENDIEFELLSELSDDDLGELGLSLGHRRKFLKVSAELKAGAQRGALAGAAEASPMRVEAERRQLSIMFCDLVGSTELSTRLDPEDLRELMRHYQDTVAGIVARFEGHVAKFLGDGVLAFFGWPRAYEDQAERAVRSGLAAVEAVTKLNTRDGQALEARVGIATGQVVIGDIVGESAKEDGAVAGTTPNLAARLQEVASSGQVVIGPTTRMLIGDALALEDMGLHQLRGFAEPAAIWRVLGESKAESRFEATHIGHLTPFVGRKHELGLLAERWALAEGGEGQVVLLMGEPGIGKSRLLEALRSQIAAGGHTRLRYQCSPFHTNSALYPVIRQLQRAARFTPTDRPEQRLDKLEAILTGSADVVAVQAPLFATLLSLPAERYCPLDLTPQQLKQRTLDALNEQLLILASQQPVLFCFEDAHWIDPTSRDLLGQTIGRIANARVLMIITHRPEFENDWTGHPHVMSLTLNRLSRAQGAKIALTAGADRIGDDVVARIVERADGVPLFIEELTRAVVETGGTVSEANTPASLQASLTERLDRLGDAKEIAQIGAVIGRDFSEALISAVSGTSDPDLGGKLKRLLASGLVLRRGTPSESIYTFKHALVHDAAYDSLLRDKRQRLHGAVAEALLRKLPELADREPETLAHHYTEAGHPGLAITYWQSAGARAIEQSANVEAVGHFSRALDLVRTMPESSERDLQELDLQLALGAASIAPKSYAAEDVRLAFQRAKELCQIVGGVDHRFQAVKGLWNCHVLRGELKVAHDLANELSELAEHSSEPDRLLSAQRVSAMTHLGLGEYGKSLQACERGIELYDPDRQAMYLRGFGEDPGLFCYSYSTWNNYFVGHPDAAMMRAQQALDIARKHPSRYALSYVFALVATFFLWQRRLDPALECAETAHEVAEEQSIVQWQAWAEIIIGNALAGKGQLQEGLSWIQKGREAINTIRSQLALMVLTPTIAQAYCFCGEYAEGLELIEQVKSTLRQTGIGEGVSEIHRLRGNLLAASGATTDQIEAAYREGLKLARTQEAKMLELRAATDLARLWQINGKNADAYELLAPIHGWFTEGFDTADLMDAKALIDELA